jgi:Zn-dependent protease/CBS domain-containing protein
VNESLRLGRFRGIEVGAHWSVLVIGALLVWSLAVGTLPALAPGNSAAAYWLVATAAVIAFWAALLAHEFAHSVVAIRTGLTIDGITLWLLGGVSQLHGEAATPDDELRIALAGPVTSFAIALGAGTLATAVETVGGPTLFVAALGWLAAVNLLLAVFNLAPGAPLDGGRVLHAIMWRRSGDRAAATLIATKSGQLVGYSLVGVGFLLVVLGNLGGLWFVLLGWFLVGAARVEASNLLLRDALGGVRVADVMTARPITAPGDITVTTLLDDYVLGRHCSAFPITDGSGQITGLVTLRQVRGIAPSERTVRDVASIASPIDQVPRGRPDEPVLALLDRMGPSAAGDGRALVFDDGRLVGIVSPTDLNRALDVARMRQR